MCNKRLVTSEDVQMNMKEAQMNSISVDNECFYSDHIVQNKPDILTIKELKRVFLRALPHEFKSKERYLRNLDSKEK